MAVLCWRSSCDSQMCKTLQLQAVMKVVSQVVFAAPLSVKYLALIKEIKVFLVFLVNEDL